MKKFAMLLLINLALLGAAQAQTIIPSLDDPGHKGDLARAEKKKAVERFDAMDSDRNGKLAREEVAQRSNYLSSNFDKLDKDKDGFLNWEEFLGHNRWPK